MRGIGLERQVAELVDDQELRLREVREAILEPFLVLDPSPPAPSGPMPYAELG